MIRNLFIATITVFMAVNAFASDVVICQTGTDDGLQVTGYLKSVNTPNYSTDPKNLINPDLSALSGIPEKYWKCAGGAVVEMTAGEKTATDQAEADALEAQQCVSIDDLDVSIKEAFVAWLQLYNSKVPAQYQVSNAELKTQVRTNLGVTCP